MPKVKKAHRLKRVVAYVEDDVEKWLEKGMREAGLHSMSAHVSSLLARAARR